MDKQLLDYLNHEVIPRYDRLDAAHQIDHVLHVIHESLKIARDYSVNLDMVYVIACFHDLGLLEDRKTHHIVGGRMLLEDEHIQNYFQPHELKIMAEAIEDHRASNAFEPRSIYGKIIAEADRDLNIHHVLKRTIQYGLKHYPHLEKDEHILRATKHIEEKYGRDGYLKLWLETEKNIAGKQALQMLMDDPIKLKENLDEIYDKIVK